MKITYLGVYYVIKYKIGGKIDRSRAVGGHHGVLHLPRRSFLCPGPQVLIILRRGAVIILAKSCGPSILASSSGKLVVVS